MSGSDQLVKVVLRNPLDYTDQIDYTIQVYDHQLARDWIVELKQLLINQNVLEKNFCFLGWPKSARTLEYLCDELNTAITQINKFSLTGVWVDAGLPHYLIEEYFTPDVIRYDPGYGLAEGKPGDKFLKTMGLFLKQNVMNQLHNHFEILQGTVENLSLIHI